MLKAFELSKYTSIGRYLNLRVSCSTRIVCGVFLPIVGVFVVQRNWLGRARPMLGTWRVSRTKIFISVSHMLKSYTESGTYEIFGKNQTRVILQICKVQSQCPLRLRLALPALPLWPGGLSSRASFSTQWHCFKFHCKLGSPTAGPVLWSATIEKKGQVENWERHHSGT